MSGYDEEHQAWLNEQVFTLTREQAQTVMCLVEIVEGYAEHIAELHKRLGITELESFEEHEREAVAEADYHDRLRIANERWTLHSAIQVALGRGPSFENNGLRRVK